MILGVLLMILGVFPNPSQGKIRRTKQDGSERSIQHYVIGLGLLLLVGALYVSG